MKPMVTEPRIAGGRLVAAILLSMTLALAACDDKPQRPAPAKMFQQERGALDKAKGVEQAVAKGTGDLKQEEEKQEK